VVSLAACKVTCEVERNRIPEVDHEGIVALVRGLANDVGDVTSVTCPRLINSLNASVTCVVEFTEGPTREMAVVVTDATTGHVVAQLPSVVNRAKVTSWLTEQLAEARVMAKTIKCPGNRDATVGTTFVCSATLTAGPSIDVTMTLKEDSLRYDVDAVLLEIAPVEAVALEKAREHDPTIQSVDCGDGRAPPGLLTCTAAGPSGQTTVEVTLTGDAPHPTPPR
jgi:hypothetical protein